MPAGRRPQSAVIPAKNAVAINAKEVATLIANRKGRSRIGRVAVIRSDRAHQQMDSESLYTCSIEGYTHGPPTPWAPAVTPLHVPLRRACLPCLPSLDSPHPAKQDGFDFSVWFPLLSCSSLLRSPMRE